MLNLGLGLAEGGGCALLNEKLGIGPPKLEFNRPFWNPANARTARSGTQPLPEALPLTPAATRTSRCGTWPSPEPPVLEPARCRTARSRAWPPRNLPFWRPLAPKPPVLGPARCQNCPFWNPLAARTTCSAARTAVLEPGRPRTSRLGAGSCSRIPNYRLEPE